MEESQGRIWFILIAAPIALLLIALPLFGALQHASGPLIPREHDTPPWRVELARVDEALRERNVSAAARAWHEAHRAAIGSRRWDAMVDVGQAYLRIGDRAGARPAAEPKARQAYLIALFRARQAGSVDGILRVADAFAGLGDMDIVERSIRMAERLATRTPDDSARQKVRRFAEQFPAGLVTVSEEVP
jgi:hypothetical protein